MPTPTRTLGTSSITVPPFCLGGNVFGWTIDQPTSFAILDAYLDAGFSFIDTADIYSRWKPGNHGGESETILGHWCASRKSRSKIILATKVGMMLDTKGLAKDYILRTADESLQRLQTDYIDLYQSHKDDPATPLDETLAAYDQLLKQGKVRIIGASNYTADRLQQALTTANEKHLPKYQMLQPEYNLYTRDKFETDLQPLCQQHHIGVIPYFSLASGFLTGKYRSEADLGTAARAKSVKQYLTPRGTSILAALDTVAAKHHATPAQVALAWLLAQPTITAPIASATSLPQLTDLLAAVNLHLDPDSLAQLTTASAP
jgi:aryl-alcohol dehydrogenase-like predicted oxidoreductase